jgi:Fur family ferric uptake transcriptional regulator
MYLPFITFLETIMSLVYLAESKQIRLTKHKKIILELFRKHKHLDANQIYNLLNKQQIKISLSTIYRTLLSLEKHHIVIKHNFNINQLTYELNTVNEHHDHLLCVKCNQVIEFVNQEIERLQVKIAEQHNFKIINHQLNLFGVCHKCQSDAKHNSY